MRNLRWMAIGAMGAMAVATTCATAARAQDTGATAVVTPAAEPDVGIQGALRIAHAIPMGQLADAPTGGFSDNVTPQTVVMFDVGMRVHRLVYGLYLGLGFGSVTDSQKPAFESQGFGDPSVFTFHIGPEVHYWLLDEGSIRPWIGLGTGLEVLGVGANNGSIHLSDNYTAWEMVRPMIGVDFMATHGFGLGLYVDWSLARFGSHTVTVEDTSQTPSQTLSKTDVTIENPAFHQWLTIGVRATLGN